MGVYPPGGKAGSILAVEISGAEAPARQGFAFPPVRYYGSHRRGPPDPVWGQQLRSTLGNMFRSSAAGSPLFVA